MRAPYFKPGTWIAIPVSGGWVPCLVARKNKSASLMLLYVFPRHDVVPSIDDLQGRTLGHSKFVMQTGMAHTWVIIGMQPGFRMESWPIPPFVHKSPELKLANGEVIESRAFLRRYDEKLARIGPEIPIPMEDADQYPRDVLMGPQAAENYISKLV